MSHYAKLATLAVRWVAVGLAALGVPYIVLGVRLVQSGQGQSNLQSDPVLQGYWWMGFGCVLGGILVFALSKPLGRYLAAGLD